MPPPLDFDWIARKPREIDLGPGVDFFRLYAAVKPRFEASYLFESLALPRHQDRYYAMGFDPAAEFLARGDRLTIHGAPEIVARLTGAPAPDGVAALDSVNPYDALATSWRGDRVCRGHQGGLIGYVGHEAVNYVEPSLSLEEHPDFETFRFGLYLDGLLYDSVTGLVSYYTYGEDRSALCRALIEEAAEREPPRTLGRVAFEGHSESREDFIAAVERTKEKIRTGYSFQAEVGFKSHYAIEGDKLAIYTRLRQVNPSPYMYFMKFGDQELLGASPEILVSCNKGYILTTPTAGTIQRGATEAEDVALARQLLSDPKEIAEHNMLVDLHRNDVGRVARTGTVQVTDLMYVIKFSHVQHIVSNVVGVLDDDKTALDALAAILPGGVVTGAPKIETIKIIDANEKRPRGPYGGAVGRFGFNGDCDFCLPLRSIFCKGDRAFAQTSAGIVYDSVPEKEYAEVGAKLAAMRQVLSELGGGDLDG